MAPTPTSPPRSPTKLSVVRDVPVKVRVAKATDVPETESNKMKPTDLFKTATILLNTLIIFFIIFTLRKRLRDQLNQLLIYMYLTIVTLTVSPALWITMYLNSTPFYTSIPTKLLSSRTIVSQESN